MRKKVLVLSGSPRKNGNSDMLCDAFVKGAEKAGHLTEKVFIQNKKIFPCLACYGCRNTHLCVQKDDMGEILEKMVQADVIVLATPVYFYSLSGQLKTLIDRTLPQYTQIANKDFYFMATAAAGKKSMERTMDALRGFADCLGQFTRDYTQTVKRAADNKRRYAPGKGHSAVCCGGIQRGRSPFWHTTLRSKV